MQRCLSDVLGDVLSGLRRGFFYPSGDFEADTGFGADELCCQLSDAIAVLRFNPVEFDAIGCPKRQQLVTFVVPEKHEWFDPGAVKLCR
jgi:hypothetical protein